MSSYSSTELPAKAGEPISAAGSDNLNDTQGAGKALALAGVPSGTPVFGEKAFPGSVYRMIPLAEPQVNIPLPASRCGIIEGWRTTGITRHKGIA